MEPKVLADALVEAGILGIRGERYTIKGRFERDHCYPDGDSEYVVTDWRVAGKVLELRGGFFTAERAFELSDCENVELPRAIIEAWYEARQ